MFGEDLTLASDALPVLGLAMTALACTYLGVQYLLALRRWRFAAVLAAGVVAETGALAAVGPALTTAALVLLAVQASCAAAVLSIALGRSPQRMAPVPAGAEPERVPAGVGFGR